MWSMDPELQKQLEWIKGMAKRSRQTPTKEWPLVFVGECEAMLVVREWPGGEVTAYAVSKDSDDPQ